MAGGEDRAPRTDCRLCVAGHDGPVAPAALALKPPHPAIAMNTQSLIDDPTRASRYLAGQLSEAECADYEAHFAADPEALAELEATARLKIGLQRLRRTGEISELL